jgi:hypothetical protein
MSSPTGIIVLLALGLLAAFVLWLVWQSRRPDKTADWPVTEATIQSVGKVVINAGRSSYSVDVGDFSYNVNNEYYSGRLRISRSSSTGDAAQRDLIHQNFQVRYNPQKPEEHSVPEAELGGFILAPFDESLGSDVDPIDLNIDKI